MTYCYRCGSQRHGTASCWIFRGRHVVTPYEAHRKGAGFQVELVLTKSRGEGARHARRAA